MGRGPRHPARSEAAGFPSTGDASRHPTSTTSTGRVINRNNRLKKLVEMRAPEVILRNEKRMFAGGGSTRCSTTGVGPRRSAGRGQTAAEVPFRHAQGQAGGRFRQNLLGKRVDYSGRSVIVVGPELKLHQCGLPKAMAVELFKPFIIHELEKRGEAGDRQAREEDRGGRRPQGLRSPGRHHSGPPRAAESGAPTLHRLGIQAFEPVLVEGKAIRIHPLVCAAFNADFDGDQMAVHVPLSFEGAAGVAGPDALVQQHPAALERPAGGGPQPRTSSSAATT